MRKNLAGVGIGGDMGAASVNRETRPWLYRRKRFPRIKLMTPFVDVFGLGLIGGLRLLEDFTIR